MHNSWSRDRLSLPEPLDPFSDVNECRMSMETWQPLWSHQTMPKLEVRKEKQVGQSLIDEEFELESWKAQLEYLSSVQQERHRVSTRWAVGGVSAVIHDDGQDMECPGREGEDVVSKSHFLQLVEQTYQMLFERLQQDRLQKHWETSTLLSLLLDLHRCCEREMSSILSSPMAPVQRSQLFLSQHYLQCQAQHQDTFETAALVLGISEWRQNGHTSQLYESRNEMLAVSRLQDFICTTYPQKPRQSVVTTFDPKALVKLGRIHIQKMILEQLCKNHHEERTLLLQFIYKQMIPGIDVEPCTEKLVCNDTPINSQNEIWDNPPSSRPGHTTGSEKSDLQLSLLEKAFVLYWERRETTVQLRRQSPAIVGLMELQLMQLANVQELTQQMEGQFTNDLVTTYCSLYDDWQNNQHYSNLAVMFLELVTPEMDVDQIEQGLGSADVSVHDNMDNGVVLDICKVKPSAVRGDAINSSEITAPTLDNFPLPQEPTLEVHKLEALEEICVGYPENVEKMDLGIPIEASAKVKSEICEAEGGLVRDQQHLEETESKSGELDVVSVAQNGEQMFEISVDHPASQSQQGEISLHIPLDQASVKAMSNREQDQTQKQQQGDGPDLKSRDLTHIGGPRCKTNTILISEEEKKHVLRSLAHVQRKAEEKRRREKERQTLRVLEGLSIARNRISTIDRPFPQTYGQDCLTEDLLKESVHWRTKVRETLEHLRQERTFILRSKGERNTASFNELFNPVETKDFTDGKNQSEHSKEVQHPDH
ncbi:uncharacterized protein LOC116985269 isoform X2 [Amblyraja radiata]|uniref:uncharacterized protein LOC116985269 isoform X2 n=1 Tax=Amblyraja radiata TaxID=386614 RepID=UPI001402ADFB|nr:uncharacterized protein LOC116985269 isoform X2 [Amblyraja radiata]